MLFSGGKGLVACAAALTLGGFAPGGQAQESATGAPAGFGVGPLKAFPGVDLAIGRDDNLYSSDANKRSSNFTILSPYLRLEGTPGPHKFDAAFRLDSGRFSDASADDYDDYALTGNADLVFTGRAGLRLKAEHRRAHDPRGSTDRPFGAEPDEFNYTGAEGIFGYGAQGAQGRIEVDAGYFEKRYQNNRAFTEASDYDVGSAGGTFLWRVQPKTQLLFQGKRHEFDYRLPSSTLDSTENRLYVGARWEATAKTDGTVKIGRLKKDFRDASREDVSSGSWDVGVRWSPLTYSAVDLQTSKQTTESTGFGNTILTKAHSLTWSHDWSSRFRTQVLGNLRNDKYQGATREDDTRTAGVRLTYQFRRWLRFGVEYLRTDRDSDIQAFDYQRNFILFSVGATL
jgi:hypothetical protein